MKCPDCGSACAGGSCSCGWAAPVSETRERNAELVRRTRDAVMAKANASAREYCAKHGLHTVEQMRAFIGGKAIGRAVMREPGED